jgi:hypothetical protein
MCNSIELEMEIQFVSDEPARSALEITQAALDADALLDSASHAIASKDYQLATDLCSRALEAKCVDVCSDFFNHASPTFYFL